MNRAHRPLTRGFRRSATTLALVLAAGLSAGCDKTGDAEFKLREAASLLAQTGPTATGEFITGEDALNNVPEGLSGDDAQAYQAAAAEFARQVKADQSRVAQAKSLLNDVVKSGLPAQKAAANLLLAEASFAEAGQKLAQATREAREFRASMGQIARDLVACREWRHQAAVAAKSAGPDAGQADTTVQDWNEARDEGRETITKLDAEIQQLTTERDRLKAEAQAIRSRAAAARAAAANLRIRSESADEQQALALLQQWRVHARDADTLELEAERVEDGVRTIEPRLLDLQAHIAAQRANVQALENALAELSRARGDAARRRDAFLKQASDLAAEIEQALFAPNTGLIAQRDELYGQNGTLADAANAYQSAQSSATSARNELKAHADVASTRAMQARGSVWWQVAADLADLNALLAEIAALPDFAGANGDEIRSAMESSGTLAAEARENAGAAFENAAMSLGSAMPRDDRSRVYGSHAVRMLTASRNGLSGDEVSYADILADSLAGMARGQEHVPEIPPEEMLDSDIPQDDPFLGEPPTDEPPADEPPADGQGG